MTAHARWYTLPQPTTLDALASSLLQAGLTAHHAAGHVVVCEGDLVFRLFLHEGERVELVTSHPADALVNRIQTAACLKPAVS